MRHSTAEARLEGVKFLEAFAVEQTRSGVKINSNSHFSLRYTIAIYCVAVSAVLAPFAAVFLRFWVVNGCQYLMDINHYEFLYHHGPKPNDLWLDIIQRGALMLDAVCLVWTFVLSLPLIGYLWWHGTKVN